MYFFTKKPKTILMEILNFLGSAALLIAGAVLFLFILYNALWNIKGDQVGVMERRWIGKEMANGRTVALKGEIGVQATILGPGLYLKIPFVIRVTKHKYLRIDDNQIGLVSAIAGNPIPQDRYFAGSVECNSFQDGEAFLKNGGEKGPQLQILMPGEHRVNPHLFEISVVPAVSIANDQVGIVEAVAGLPVDAGRIFANKVESNNFQDATLFLENKGQKGPQPDVLPPGFYRINTLLFKVKVKNATVIAGGTVGLVTAMDGVQIPAGRLLGKHVEEHSNFEKGEEFIKNGGEKGRQLDFLMPGTYRINTDLFNIQKDVAWVEVGPDEVGIVTVLEGKPIMEKDQIAAKDIDLNLHNNFQNASAFISHSGEKGLQSPVLRSGNYAINTWFAEVEKTPMVNVPIGHVAVVVSYVGADGEDTSGTQFKHGNIVKKGQKGVWEEVLHPGKYPLNTHIMKVELVPTTNIVLNWANARTESHALDEKLSTITVRSRDGFTFNLDVSQIIHVPANEAPKVIARFGNMKNLVSQVLEPTIGNYFRNSAQNSDAIDFLKKRSDRQGEAKEHIVTVLQRYNVDAVDTLIGDINPPETLMKTLTDRKLAEEMKLTFDQQKIAEDTRRDFESAKANADIQPQVIQSERQIFIAENHANAEVKKSEGMKKAAVLRAEGEKESKILTATGEAEATKLIAVADAEKTEKVGLAEAKIILEKGKSNAEAYKLEVAAMGEGNFGRIKVMEQIARENVKLIPENIIVGGGEGGGGLIENFLGISMIEKLTGKKFAETSVEEKTEEKK